MALASTALGGASAVQSLMPRGAGQDQLSHVTGMAEAALRAGLSPEQACYEYLKLAQDWVGYGSSWHEVADESGTRLWLATTPRGLGLWPAASRAGQPTAFYPWGKDAENGVDEVKVADRVIKVTS